MDANNTPNETLTVKQGRRLYERPALTFHGNVEDITRATFRVGTGDLLGQLLNHDVACNPYLSDYFCTTGS